jgi:hypothetical protein
MITREIQTAAEDCPPQRMERHNVPPRSILKPRRRLAVGTLMCHASIRAGEMGHAGDFYFGHSAEGV